ncbi:MAG: acetyl-CoA C-acetyltransferase, partial [Candidatus Thermoplasmatota archaeon]|nr:acetyl-CoA C-acetyltransferase [Candidatus Thermoplasmatota archaeon]
MANHTAVICGVARTPIGRFMGTLSSLSSIDLGVAAVKELCQRVGFDPSSGIVDEVLMGQVLQAGVGQAPARQVALGAGLPVTTSCVTINMVCGSSLRAVMQAATSVRMGEHQVVIAGGM